MKQFIIRIALVAAICSMSVLTSFAQEESKVEKAVSEFLKKYEGTDDASLLEHLRIPVKLVEGSRENIKITEPCDIFFAEAILKARAEQTAREASK